MKSKTNVTSADTISKTNSDAAISRKESKNPWLTKWVNGALRYINDMPVSRSSKINTILQFKINALDSETFSLKTEDRQSELDNQNWSRIKSQKLAKSEGIILNDGHWAVISYLRNHYLEQGVPRYARSLSRDLGKEFSVQGGSKYLRNLFPGGPVTQGSRIANLRTPANATDVSFGTSY